MGVSGCTLSKFPKGCSLCPFSGQLVTSGQVAKTAVPSIWWAFLSQKLLEELSTFDPLPSCPGQCGRQRCFKQQLGSHPEAPHTQQATSSKAGPQGTCVSVTATEG